MANASNSIDFNNHELADLNELNGSIKPHCPCGERHTFDECLYVNDTLEKPAHFIKNDEIIEKFNERCEKSPKFKQALDRAREKWSNNANNANNANFASPAICL